MARILLVEDEPWLGELYLNLFVQEHEVTWCRDGYEAMGSIDSWLPDVIILDIMLPWANGIQVLHELASYRDTASIPIVLFSVALPELLDDDVLRAYGVAAALDKTTTRPRQVIKTINDILQNASRSG